MAASVIAKCDGYSDVVGTINGDQFTIVFPPSEDENGSTWTIYYQDERGCPQGTTTWHVEPTPVEPCVYTIYCDPTEAQLNDGTAKTVVTVTTSRSGCDTHFTINGSGSYDGGGSGYTFIATSARTYTFACVDDPSVQCTFVVSEAPQPCVVTSISCNPTSYTLSSTSDSAKTIVTVVSSSPCSKKWKATVDSREVTGNSGDQLVVTSPQTVTITSVEDTTKSCTFYVTSAETPSFDVKLQFGVDSNYGTYTYTDSTSEYVRPFDGGLRIYVDTTFQGELTVDLVGELTHGEETPRPSKFWIWDNNYPSQVSSLESFNFQPNGPNAWYTEGTEYDRPSATINLVNGGVLKVSVQYR